MENVIEISNLKPIGPSPSKNELMFDEIVRHYCPELAAAVDSKFCDPDDLNIERLIEKCIAIESELTWCGADNDVYDFLEDKSDAKTASIKGNWENQGDGKYKYWRVTGSISNVETKVGALRCVVYDSENYVLHYFLIPAKWVHVIATTNTNGTGRGVGKSRVNLKYNCEKDTFNSMDRFRVESFEDICGIVND